MNRRFFSDRKAAILPTCTIILGLVFLLCRVRFGYCFNDEPFIISLSHRLSFGDKLLYDEWHPSQLFGIVLLPAFRLYYAVHGSTEGILLFFRLCFCAFWFCSSLCVYQTCKRYSRFSIAAFIYLILFAPLDYMTCSYTSFGLMGVLLLGCLFLHEEDKDKKSNAILVGIASSLLCCIIVLSSPFFSAVFLLAIPALFISAAKYGGSNRKHYYSVLAVCLMCTILLGAVCFYMFSLRGHGLRELLERIPYVLDDPAHKETVLSKILSTVRSMCRPLLILYLLGVVLLVLYVVFFKSVRARIITAEYWVCVFIYSRIAIADLTIGHHAFNYEMLDLGLLSFIAFTLLKHKPWKLFFGFSCLGITYAICTFLASNTKLMSISAAMVPCGVAGIIYLSMLAEEIGKDVSIEMRSSAVIAICCLLLCQFSLQICIRTSRQYWDYTLPELSETISCGAAKGLITAPEHCEEYESNFIAIKTLLSEAGDVAGKRFLNLSSNPVMYLDADLQYGTFSAWTFGYHESLPDRLSIYYHLNPEKIPDLVYFTDEDEDPSRFLDFDAYRVIDYYEHHLLVRLN